MVDFANPDWSYILGVIHGDGSIAPRSITIAVGYQDSSYSRVLVRLLRSMGCEPKVYRCRSALSVQVHGKVLADEFRLYKASGIWSWPGSLVIEDYLAGVFDTDGWVATLPSKRIGICLKRSGNLKRLASYLNRSGVGDFPVRETNSTYKGVVYPTELLSIRKNDDILKFASSVRLRHPRKVNLLKALVRQVRKDKSVVHLYQRVALWCKEPKTWKEIAKEFRLTRMETQSVLGVLRKKKIIATIPPPVQLAKFVVKEQSSLPPTTLN